MKEIARQKLSDKIMNSIELTIPTLTRRDYRIPSIKGKAIGMRRVIGVKKELSTDGKYTCAVYPLRE